MDTYLPFPYLPDAPDRLPWVSQLQAIAVLLAALSWLAIVLSLPLNRGFRILGVLTAAQPVSLGAWAIISVFTDLIDPDMPVSRLWWLSGEIIAIIFLIVAAILWAPYVTVSLVLVLFGATAFGMLHTLAETGLFGLSGVNWDITPWTGLGTALILCACGIVTIVRALRRHQVPIQRCV
jgi:hypothetical protein